MRRAWSTRCAAALLAAGLLLTGCTPGQTGEESSAGTATTESTAVTTGTAASTTAGQTAFVFEPYTWDLDNGTSDKVWVCPKSLENNTTMAEFIEVITDKSRWPKVFEHAVGLKLFIQQIATTSVGNLRKIADFVRENDLMVEVEVGGIRVCDENAPNDQMGENAAKKEFLCLFSFIRAGGRIDYITTDGSMAQYATGRIESRKSMTLSELAEQQMLYFRYMLDYRPNLKVGAIEAMGFFWIQGAERQYQATDSTLDRLDFEEYIDTMQSVGERHGVRLSHFELDFNLAEIEYDGDYGRLLAAEDYCQSHGIYVGLIATNTFHKGFSPNAVVKDKEAAAHSAVTRAVQYFEGYRKAGGHCNYLVLQRWQPYPDRVGSEEEPDTCMGLFRQIVESPYFPGR